MKSLLPIALILSLALNVVCAWLLFAPAPPKPAEPRIAAVPVAAPPLGPEIWRGLATGELPTLVLRLRAAGFPPDVVRTIVAAKVRELFAPRRRALLGPGRNTPYWMNPPRDAKAQLALNDLEHEQQQMISELLGVKAEPVPPDRRLAFLSGEKAAAASRILRDHEEQRSKLWMAGASDSNDRRFKQLEQQKQAALAQVLTPAEVNEYNLRLGETADRLRERLAVFEPTEAEFRAIHALQAAFEEKWGTNFEVGQTLEYQEQRQAAEEQLKTAVQAALGPERAPRYVRATDWDYIATTQLIDRLGLPRAAADQLFGVQREFEQKRAEIAKAGPAAEAKLVQLQQEAIERVTPLLGGKPERVEIYQKHGGDWLKYLVPEREPPRN